MAEATNYVYLAILICLQYLGLQHESYEVTITFSEVVAIQQPMIKADLTKTMDKENQWTVITQEKNYKVPMTVVKDSVTDFEKGKTKTTKFHNIDFDRFSKQKDTIFNKKNKPLMVVSENENTIMFKVLDNSAYDRITMKINQ